MSAIRVGLKELNTLAHPKNIIIQESEMAEQFKQKILSSFMGIIKGNTMPKNPIDVEAGKENDITPDSPQYCAEISRRNPTCILILLDRSNSMNDPFGNEANEVSKATFVSDAVNGILNELIIQNQRGSVVNRFHVGLVGYGLEVGSAFSGPLVGRNLVALDELQMNPDKIVTKTRKEPDGLGGYIQLEVSAPTWVSPVAGGFTPMCKAIDYAKNVIAGFISEHPSCFPPIVLNITDGEATDGDPSVNAYELTRISSGDGHTLLFNLHCSSFNGPALKFPSKDAGLDAKFARTLFYMSSTFPEVMIDKANSRGFELKNGARGFVFNSGIEDVVDFLKIGTTMSMPNTGVV
jgi:hypothetical protein